MQQDARGVGCLCNLKRNFCSRRAGILPKGGSLPFQPWAGSTSIQLPSSAVLGSFSLYPIIPPKTFAHKQSNKDSSKFHPSVQDVRLSELIQALSRHRIIEYAGFGGTHQDHGVQPLALYRIPQESHRVPESIVPTHHELSLALWLVFRSFGVNLMTEKSLMGAALLGSMAFAPWNHRFCISGGSLQNTECSVQADIYRCLILRLCRPLLCDTDWVRDVFQP